MAGGCLDILFFGGLSLLFEKMHQAKNKELDRVEIEAHTWAGMFGRTHYNRRYLGPIQIKTFLNTSKSIASKVLEYEAILNKLLVNRYDDSTFSNIEKNNDVYQLSILNKRMIKYMEQIDRRERLRCYADWKDNNPESFSIYQKARTKIIELNAKLEDVKKQL